MQTGARGRAEGAPTAARWSTEQILEVVGRFWGHRELRPLQERAIRAGLEGWDSLVVMPTGGGKSLCYQVPPVLRGHLCVVVSPLIALMKDQADGLAACGYPAAALHSNMSAAEQAEVERGVVEGRYRLLLIAPERLLTGRGLSLIRKAAAGGGVQREGGSDGTAPTRLHTSEPWHPGDGTAASDGDLAFAIDEAHCISQWGHDFRPEYRRLAELRGHFPGASLHGFTATATTRVREDIVRQLGLREPEVLVGRFDRPNLVYRVIPRRDRVPQVLQVLARHKGEAGIVYCISRKDTENLAESLRKAGVNAAAYHAGMEAGARRRVQERFSRERLDVVVATVAFGMGIDRGDVRCVIHAACPKSVEHYQQETGRAGRDGLEAECVLLHSGADAQKWRSLIQKSVDEALDRGVEVDPAWLEAQHGLLRAMERVATTLVCRHKALSEYFGQAYEPPEGRAGCGACDVCLGEVEAMDDGTVVAQKILSCVARVGQRFGASHVAGVLVREDSERIRRQGHERLSTFGLLRGQTKRGVAGLIEQLLGLGVLERVGGEYPVLRLNAASMEVLKGSRPVRLAEPGRGKAKRADVERETWEGVDRGLFEALRSLRKGLAEERGVPPYVIFGDATLRELARARPGSLETMRAVRGIGQRKLADLGEVFLEAVRSYAGEHGLELDVGGGIATQSRGHGTHGEASAADGRVPESRAPVFALFDQGLGIEEVARRTERAPGAVAQMLVEYIKRCAPDSLGAWVDPGTYELVRGAVRQHGFLSPKQLHEVVGEGATYEQVRWVRAHLAARG